MAEIETIPEPASSQEATKLESVKGLGNVVADIGVAQEAQPQPLEKEVTDTSVIFVPFEDFTGRINQTDFDFRKDIPTKVPKTEANVWIEAKKGYIK